MLTLSAVTRVVPVVKVVMTCAFASCTQINRSVTAQAAATVGEVIEAERIVALAMLLALTCKECGSKDCDSVQMERRQAVDCAESVRRAAQLARGFAASQDRGNQHSRAASRPHILD
jgi:hypothetical protein